VPSRGDLVWTDFEPHVGREQGGHRPAIVLSIQRFNRLTGLAVACPITNRRRGYPFEVVLPDGLRIAGVVLGQQVRSIDWRAREVEFIQRAPESIVEEVLDRVSTLFD
jgi:mRNA interferase MazF